MVRWTNVLWKPEERWALSNGSFLIREDDAQLRKKQLKFNTTKINQVEDLLLTLVSCTSRWYWLKRIVATMLKWLPTQRAMNVELLKESELCILRLVQYKAFKYVIDILQAEPTILDIC